MPCVSDVKDMMRCCQISCVQQCNQSRAQNQMIKIAERCGYVDILPYPVSVKRGSLCHNLEFSPTYPLPWPSYPQLSTELSTNLSTKNWLRKTKLGHIRLSSKGES